MVVHLVHLLRLVALDFGVLVHLVHLLPVYSLCTSCTVD